MRMRSRILQIELLMRWKTPKFQPTSESDCAIVRHHFPSLWDVSEYGTELKEIGRFLSLLDKYSITLAIFFIQKPIDLEIQMHCDALHFYGTERCPGMALDELRFEELAAALRTLRDQCLAQDVGYAVEEEALLPLDSQKAMNRAYTFTYPLAQRVFAAIVDEHQDIFRRSFTFRSFFKISCAFARDASSSRGMYICTLDSTRAQLNQFEPSDAELEYEPAGERVSMRAFCDPAWRIEESTTCLVCMFDIERGNYAEPIAQTMCKHFPHPECMDNWVNDSGMLTSNACPTCRHVLCDARQRTHTTQRDDFGHSVDDDDVAHDGEL